MVAGEITADVDVDYDILGGRAIGDGETATARIGSGVP